MESKVKNKKTQECECQDCDCKDCKCEECNCESEKEKGKDKKKHCKCDNEKEQQELALMQDKVLRLTAEIQNIKRRNDEEIARLCKYDGEKIIMEILPILDNFERAIKLDDHDMSDEIKKFLSGFKMIYTNLLSILEKYEVKEIDCEGLEFDPEKMEAVLTEKNEKLPANVVVEVLQKGYTYKDKIIRVAMVKVNE